MKYQVGFKYFTHWVFWHFEIIDKKVSNKIEKEGTIST
jgi:hypothetical protein